jgi:hypothetical protein
MRRKRPLTASEMQRLSVQARMQRLSPEDRSALARHAAQVRWAKVRARAKKKKSA